MASDAPSTPDLDDPLLQARIDHAIKPYESRLSPETLAECRRMLAFLLTTHPEAAPLMERIRGEIERKGSGVVARKDPAAIKQAAKRLAGGKRG